jgi:16S rRNA (adenine1518-N6/adenine1519-N6)-dimethyltransferase
VGKAPGDGPRLPREAGTQRVGEAAARAARHGLVPRKSLGQHFLVSPGHVARIVARVAHCASAFEVGPGPATLTEALCHAVGEVVAVDIDPRVEPIVREAAPCARMIVADALELDWLEVLRSLPAPRAIVSNMPYNITGPLLAKVQDALAEAERAVLMMQAEVADRILAPAGDSRRGALSVLLQSECELEHVATVPPGAFVPPPKVTSKVLELRLRPERPEPGYREFVRQGFRQPRKTLAGNLQWPAPLATERLAQAGLSPTVRAHQLTGEQWAWLHRASKTG